MFACKGPQEPPELFHSFLKEETTPPHEWTENPQTKINGHTFEKAIIAEEIDLIVRTIRKCWCRLQSFIVNDSTISSTEVQDLRRQINDCLNFTLGCLKHCPDVQLKSKYISTTSTVINETLTPLITPLDEFNQHILVRLFNNYLGNEKCPYYQYFHTYLDLHYHLMMLSCIRGDLSEIETHLKRLVKDLICVAKKGFQLDNKSAFSCSCSKTIWLILQLTSEKFFDAEKFWSIFNLALKDDSDKSFVLWILSHVASLQTHQAEIKPNYELLESSLKSVLLNDCVNILPNLKSIEPLVCGLWLKNGRIEPYQILWDHFSKKLNTTKRKQVDLSAAQLVELTDTILWSHKDCTSDFEFFLGMLVLHVGEHPQHWGKMKGRIYSQLGPNKIRDLDGVGIFHVGLLYIVLAKINFDDLAVKFSNLVQGLSQERRQSKLVWGLYTAFIIRHVRENRSLEEIVPPFVKMLDEASQDSKKFRLLKVFTSDLALIVSSSENLQLHQWLLINTWTHKYLIGCYFPDLVSFLEVLVETLRKIDEQQVWCNWEESFIHFINPTLKCVSSSFEAPNIGGVVAAKIALLSPSLIPEIFAFYSSESVGAQVSNSFLCAILENYPDNFMMNADQENQALQAWVKICLLTKENHEQLTNNILKLDSIPQFIKDALNSSRDPLCDFINCLSVDLKRHMLSPVITKLCELAFGQADLWISRYSAEPQNEAIVLRAYTCTALAFYKIGPLLYDRHKSSSAYTRLVSSLLLPADLLVGKAPHPFILQALRKTWHLFFEATLKLKNPNVVDPFIDQTLRDLIVKYVGHFGVADSPLVKSLDNVITREAILDKLSANFFKQSVKVPESNVFKALKILEGFIEGTTCVEALKCVIVKTLSGLFELVMFHSQRNAALIVVKAATSSGLYPEVRGDFIKAVMDVTEKHLAFSTGNYFQLMGVLAKFVPSDLKSALGGIKKHISNVERMRGVGFDQNLRTHFEKLETTISQNHKL